MGKNKKKLTAAQKAAKAERKRKFMWVFMNGKQVRVKRPETIDGMSVDEFIRKNADPIWLHQNEMWEYIQDETTNNSDDEYLDVVENEDNLLEKAEQNEDIHQDILPFLEEDDIQFVSDERRKD